MSEGPAADAAEPGITASTAAFREAAANWRGKLDAVADSLLGAAPDMSRKEAYRQASRNPEVMELAAAKAAAGQQVGELHRASRAGLRPPDNLMAAHREAAANWRERMGAVAESLLNATPGLPSVRAFRQAREHPEVKELADVMQAAGRKVGASYRANQVALRLRNGRLG